MKVCSKKSTENNEGNEDVKVSTENCLSSLYKLSRFNSHYFEGFLRVQPLAFSVKVSWNNISDNLLSTVCENDVTAVHFYLCW